MHRQSAKIKVNEILKMPKNQKFREINFSLIKDKTVQKRRELLRKETNKMKKKEKILLSKIRMMKQNQKLQDMHTNKSLFFEQQKNDKRFPKKIQNFSDEKIKKLKEKISEVVKLEKRSKSKEKNIREKSTKKKKKFNSLRINSQRVLRNAFLTKRIKHLKKFKFLEKNFSKKRSKSTNESPQ